MHVWTYLAPHFRLHVTFDLDRSNFLLYYISLQYYSLNSELGIRSGESSAERWKGRRQMQYIPHQFEVVLVFTAPLWSLFRSNTKNTIYFTIVLLPSTV